MIKKALIFSVLLLGSTVHGFTPYEPATYTEVNLTLEGDYTPATYSEVNLTLGEAEAEENTAPDIISITPINGTFTNDNTYDFKFRINDSEADTLLGVLWLNSTVYGSNSSVANNTDTTITSSAIPDGSYLWHIEANDGTVNSSSEDKSIVIDIVDPSITPEFNPDNNSYYLYDRTFHFSADITDTNTVANVFFEFDGSNRSTSSDGSNYTSALTNILAGTYDFRWYADDNSGNQVEEGGTYVVLADSVSPTITMWINGSTDNATTVSGNVNLTVSINETGDCIYYINDTGTQYDIFNSTTYGSNISLKTDGDYTYNVYCVDMSNNWRDIAMTFTHSGDATPPTIYVEQPHNITYYNNSVNLEVSADESVSTWIYQYNGNGTNVTFTPNVTLFFSGNPGAKHLEVWAEDAIGNIGYNISYFNVHGIYDCREISENGTYDLTQNTSTVVSKCINITANNVIFDCHGHTIAGDDVADYGIHVYRGSQEDVNVTIKNCIVTDWDRYNIRLYKTNKVTIFNTTVKDGADDGISAQDSDYLNFTNITIDNNADYGIRTLRSNNNIITDSILKENRNADLYIYFLETDDNYLLTNVNGTGDKPILFYNESVTIEHWNNNVSSIILYNADDSVINNVTMSQNEKGVGLMLVQTDNTNISNSYFSDYYDGIYMYHSDSNILTNITLSSNADDGLYSFGNDWNVFDNITATANGDDGIYLDGTYNTIKDSTVTLQSGAGDRGIHIDDDHNTLENLTIESNSYGIYLDSTADNNTITNCVIKSNTNSGMYLRAAGETIANLIYNNMFNQSDNVYFDLGIYFNDWNTTEQVGTREYSDGVNIGGNYWTNSTGGYSDICTDSDTDGFCDTPMNVSNEIACADCTLNADHLVLSNKYSAAEAAVEYIRRLVHISTDETLGKQLINARLIR